MDITYELGINTTMKRELGIFKGIPFLHIFILYR